MTRRSILITILIIAILLPVASLTSSDKKPEFKPALPGWRFEFPRDHRIHREFKTEWWYYNGHLSDGKGKRYGYQVTFFRVGLIPGRAPVSGSRWRLHEVYMAHLALTDMANKEFFYQEKVGRGNLGLAGAKEDHFTVWVENWKVSEEKGKHRLIAGDEELGLSLTVSPTRPPIIHGKNGISQKGSGPGKASHYYSLTRMETQGTLKIKGQEIAVNGSSWMDHEFGSNQLQENQIGWDWFSIQLDNGLDLMLYQLRLEDGSIEPYSSGTLVMLDKRPIHLSRSEFILQPLGFWKSPRSGATYPASWQIQLPHYELHLELVPSVADQELMTPKSTRVTYWEGAVTVKGDFKGLTVKGKGYVELTGYDKRFIPKF